MGKESINLEKVRKLDNNNLKILIEEYHKIENNCAMVCNAHTCKYLPILKQIGAEPCKRVGLYQLCAEGYFDLIEQGYARKIRDKLIEEYGNWMSNFLAKKEFNRPVKEKLPVSNIQVIELDQI